jgi:hypothetical protein
MPEIVPKEQLDLEVSQTIWNDRLTESNTR